MWSVTHRNLLLMCRCRLDEKLKKLDEQLVKHREVIKRTRPGPAQEAAKRRALNVRPCIRTHMHPLTVHCEDNNFY